MAKMDREFLIPYLRDVCALHFALNKVSDTCSTKGTQLYYLESEQCPTAPSYPELEDTPIFAYIMVTIGSIGGVCVILLALLGFFGLGGFFGIFLGLASLFGGLMIWGPMEDWIYKIQSVKEHNDKKLATYHASYSSLDARKKEWQRRQALIPGKRNEVAFYDGEQKKIRTLLNKVYSANIIPKQYRDIYTAVYLYDFFESSYEDDVSVALGLYALEQIKEKLDIIIRNQSAILLNQYTLISEQRQAREAMENENRRLCSKLSALQASADDMVRSQRVIESNTDTMAFFAQASYFRHL